MRISYKLWVGLLILIVLLPLGLIIPAKLGAGSAWGEWSAQEIRQLVGYVPSGMSKLADKWKSPMPDYALKGREDAPLRTLSLSYVLSGLIGAATVAGTAVVTGRILARREDADAS